MKKASFIVGLIGSIFGIISGIVLLVVGLNMKVTEAFGGTVLIWACAAALTSILALVGASINNKKVIMGIFMLIGAIGNVGASLFSIPADSPVTFLSCIVAAIMLIVAGIMKFFIKE